MAKRKQNYSLQGLPVYEPLIEFLLGCMQIPPAVLKFACQLYDKAIDRAQKYVDPGEIKVVLSQEDVFQLYKLDKNRLPYQYNRYYQGESINPTSKLYFSELRSGEKEWVKKNLALFTSSRLLTREEVMTILLALVNNECFSPYYSREPFIVALWILELFGQLQSDPQTILKCRHLSDEEFMVLQGVEPYSLRFLKKYMLPQTEWAKSQCIEGLETRAIPWQEAAELFPLEEGTKVEFTSAQEMLKKLVPKSHPVYKSPTAVYGIRQYNPEDWSLVDEFSPVNRAYYPLELDGTKVKFKLGVPLLINGLITVKERMADLPNGQQYRSWYQRHSG